MITLASKKDEINSIKIAQELKEWFTKEAIKNMKIDFRLNNLIVKKYRDEVVGFLCYYSSDGFIKIIWMGTKRKEQRKGIGKSLLDYIYKKAKNLRLKGIEVKTLSDKVKYPIYEQTRKFYYSQGFIKTGYEKARLPGWDEQIIMEKKL